MMKHIAKHTLLFGAFAMLLSTMPMQAMETASADVQQEVTTKKGFFGRWTERAKNLRMKNLIKELNKAWKPFIKCVEKGDENCNQRAKVIRSIITSILALVAIVGVSVGAVAVKRYIYPGSQHTKKVKLSKGEYTSNDEKLIQAAQDYIAYATDDNAAAINALIGETSTERADSFSEKGLKRAKDMLAQKTTYWDAQIKILMS